MIQFSDIIEIVGTTFFNGNTMVAGLVVLCIILAIVMAFSKSAFTTLIIAIPLTLIFSYLNIIPDQITIILILVCVVGLAYTSKGVFSQ